MANYDPQRFLHEVLMPGLKLLEATTGIPYNKDVAVLLLTIAFQESGHLGSRYQLTGSKTVIPARGWFQFEKGGGVRGVLSHVQSAKPIREMLNWFRIDNDEDAVWRAIEGHDLLAVAMARMLLWTDPRPIPSTAQGGWDYYIRNWRPGKPHLSTWAGYYAEAEQLVSAFKDEPETPTAPAPAGRDTGPVKQALVHLAEAVEQLAAYTKGA